MKKSNPVKRQEYKAVFFDAGGTLFRPDPSVGKIYAKIALRHGCKVDHRMIEKRFKEEWKKKDYENETPAITKEKQWWYDLVQKTFLGIAEFEDYDTFFEELYDVFARPEYWKVFPEARSVIKKFRKRHFILGVISNWDSRLERLFERLKLAHYFDFILASGVVGSSKPHEGIFLEALDRAKIRPDEALHVGDSIKDDIYGSSKIGIRSVLIDRTREAKVHESPKTAHHIFTIRKLDELLDIVDGNK